MKQTLAVFLLGTVAACAVVEPDAEAPSEQPVLMPVVAVGKADTLAPIERVCATDVHCSIGDGCYDGVCRAVSCDSRRRCGDHEVCALGRCTIAWCDASQSCAPGDVCVAGKCVNSASSCIDGLDCSAEQACTMFVCVDPHCQTDTDCHQSVCVGGTCRQLGCTADRDCASDEVCREQECRLP